MTVQAHEKISIHLVSHTHWDREWYLPFENFRYRMVGMLDRLLAHMKSDPNYRFHLDGQMLIVEDYLEIRPNALSLMQELVSSGRLTIGPWYVLMDGFLVSAESFIRNIEEGDRIASRIGVSSRVAYMPDTFGHTAQMPQILSSLGLEYALVWRGLNGSPEESPTEFLWEAPNGDQIKTIHLPYWYGYTSAMNLNSDPGLVLAQISKLTDQLKGHSQTGHILLMNGFDHMEPQHDVGDKVLEWNRSMSIYMKQTTLPEYAELVFGELLDSKVIQGEFRRTNHSPDGAINLIVPNVLSSRVYLKQQNADAQQLLEFGTEPLQCISQMLFGHQDSEFVRLAWKYVLQNHPHDSICGCSVDAVHDEMEIRFMKAIQIGEQLCEETLQFIVRKADGNWIEEGDARFLLFNPLPHCRVSLIEFEFDCESEHTVYRTVRIKDSEGIVIYGEIIEDRRVCPIEKYSGVYPLSQASVRRIRVRALLSLPAFGYKLFAVRPEEAPHLSNLSISQGSPSLYNGLVQIKIMPSGQLQWTDLETGEKTESLFYFEDSGDVGDGYLYSPPIRNRKVYSSTPAQIELLSSGFEWSQLAVTHELEIPVSANSSTKERSQERKVLRVRTVMTLCNGSRTLHMRTSVQNEMKDHRLRVLFSVQGKQSPVYAGTAFDCITRPDQAVQPIREVWIENEPTQHAFHRFLYTETSSRRMTVTAHGLHEYEWIGDKRERNGDINGVLAVTLYRSVSHMAGGDRGMATKVRPGPGLETPGAQCIREMTFDYSVTWEPLSIVKLPWNIANETHVPVRSATYSSIPKSSDSATLPSQQEWIQVVKGHVDVTCIRPLKETPGLEIRMVNLTENAQDVWIDMNLPVHEVWRTALNGSREGKVSMVNSEGDGFRIQVKAKRKEIITLAVIYS